MDRKPKIVYELIIINLLCLLGTLLTAALLMRAIDRNQYHADALQHLESLKNYDSMRIGYYTDLANKWSIENKLEAWISAIHSNNDLTLDLSNLNLVNLHYEQYFSVADEINFKQNPMQQTKRVQSILNQLKHCNVRYLLDNADD